MPIYEYQCAACGSVSEFLHGINESPRLKCQSCGSKKVARVLSAGAFVFKGSGFYATDYKAKENKGDGKAVEAPSCSACSESGGCPSAPDKS